jgi:hypothetical protein
MRPSRQRTEKCKNQKYYQYRSKHCSLLTFFVQGSSDFTMIDPATGVNRLTSQNKTSTPIRAITS